MSRIASRPTGETFVASPARQRAGAPPAVEIVLPVHNEQRVLAASVRELHRYLTSEGSNTAIRLYYLSSAAET